MLDNIICTIGYLGKFIKDRYKMNNIKLIYNELDSFFILND